MMFLFNNAFILLGASYNGIDVTETTPTLRVANVTGTLLMLDCLIDFCDNLLAA